MATVAVGAEEAPRRRAHRLTGHRNRVKELIAKGNCQPWLSCQRALVDIDVVTGATDTRPAGRKSSPATPRRSRAYNNGRYQPVPVGYLRSSGFSSNWAARISAVAVIGEGARRCRRPATRP